MIADPFDALGEAVRVLDEVGVSYAVGGSVASSIFGEPRASADADLLIDLPRARADALVSAMEPAFYLSAEAAREAAARHSSFNAIHLDSMYKVDLFVAGDDLLDREQLARRRPVSLGAPKLPTMFVTAPENLVLRKLDWYRRGGGVSELQWRDVLGILKVQSGRLDQEYMRRVASQVGLGELLALALSQAAPGTG